MDNDDATITPTSTPITGRASPRERVRHDLTAIGLPEVTCVGMYEMARAERYGEAECHADELEIILVRRGAFAYPVAGTIHHVHAGEVLVIRPGEPHGGAGHLLERCTHSWIKFRVPRRGEPFLGLAAADADRLVRTMRRLPARQFKAAPRLEPLFEEVVELIGARSVPLHRLAVASRIATWLTLVAASADRDAPARTDADVEAAARFIGEHVDGDFDLDAFARRRGISPSRLRRKFRVTLGTPIHDYHLEAKVEQARKLLSGAPGRTVTDIAFALGFSSSQYFSTVFKRYTTLTPTEYRERG